MKPRTLQEIISSREGSEDEFLVANGRRIKYSEAVSDAMSFAGALREHGLNEGSKVIICLRNGPEHVRSILGSVMNGSVFIPTDPAVGTAKLQHIISDSKAGAVISMRSDASELQERFPDVAFIPPGSEGSFAGLLSSAGSDLACIIYTSGSTGMPKGVMLTHDNMVFAGGSISGYLENRKDDVILSCLPLSFDYGLYQVLMALMVGAKIVLEPSFTFPGKVLKLLETEKVTGFPIVSSMGAILLKRFDITSFDLSSLRYITNTAQPLPEWVIREIRSSLPWVRIYSMYGLTECKRCTYLDPSRIDDKPGSVGKAIPGTRTFLLDEKDLIITEPFLQGELVVKGPHIMKGYLNDPELTSKVISIHDGERTLFTGDLFIFDDDGDLFFKGRKDDLLKVSGEKVYPIEVEKEIMGLEGVHLCAVVGREDAIKGTSLVAFCTCDPGIEEEMIKAELRGRLEPYKIPDKLIFLEELPRTRNGKIDKGSLKGLLNDI